MSVYVDSVLVRTRDKESKTVYEKAQNFFKSEAVRDWFHIAVDALSTAGQLSM